MSLLSVLSVAQSGLAAAGTQLAVRASNIANLDTPGYAPREAVLAERKGGGVDVVDIRTLSESSPAGSDDAGSGVDLATEVVGLIRAETLYTANAVVVRTADRLLGTLIDVVEGRDDRDRR